MSPRASSKKTEFQDPHGLKEDKHATLEKAIGREVRRLRKLLDMTVIELAKVAGLSSGMLSKIENGLTSPSLATLQSLANALNVSMSAFFSKYEDQKDATFVKAGQGLRIERRGTRNGHQYHLLGHSIGRRIAVEPYLIVIKEQTTTFPSFQHTGHEFIHIIEGRVNYLHNGVVYEMGPGDSLFFDGEAAHGPERLVELPIRFISVITYPSDRESE
jgi:transcriptional regulator with XRE-family HTH domain